MDKNSATIKVDTKANWDKAVNYIPDCFTIIVYQEEGTVAPKVKIGDGIHTVNELPFLIQEKTVEDSILIL